MTTRRRPLPRALLSCLSVCFFCFGLALSRAQADGTFTYEESVQQAVNEYNQGNWEEAQALFRRAHAIDPNARTWRGLGSCAFELRQYVEATADLEAALVDPRKPLTAEQRVQATKLLEQARIFVSVYHVRVTPQNAQILVDGKLTQLHGETLHLDPGPHSIVVRAPGYEERQTQFRAGAGVRDDLSIELAIADNGRSDERPAKSEPAAMPRETAGAHPKRGYPWTWSLASSTVAAAIVAVSLRLRVNGLYDEFAACTEQQGNCGALEQRGQNLLLGSQVAGATAGAMALGAVLGFFLERRSGGERGRAVLQMGPQSVQLRRTF